MAFGIPTMEDAVLFEDFLRNIPLLHSWDEGRTWNTGGFSGQDLQRLYEFLLARLPQGPSLLETGAGNSTITLLFLGPAKLMSIDPNPQLYDRIHRFCQENGISTASLEPYTEASTWVLPHL